MGCKTIPPPKKSQKLQSATAADARAAGGGVWALQRVAESPVAGRNKAAVGCKQAKQRLTFIAKSEHGKETKFFPFPAPHPFSPQIYPRLGGRGVCGMAAARKDSALVTFAARAPRRRLRVCRSCGGCGAPRTDRKPFCFLDRPASKSSLLPPCRDPKVLCKHLLIKLFCEISKLL